MTLRKSLNRRYVILTTALTLFLLGLYLPEIVFAAESYEPPQFRTVQEAPPPEIPPGLKLRLLIDQDFAPYSFISATGAPAGLAVELALAACTEIGASCDIVPLPFAEVFPALLRQEGDVVVTGPRLAPEAMREAVMTRPYFRIMSRFAALTGSPLEGPSPSQLSGRRIGVVKDTVHARWLATYYGSSEIVPFEDGATAGEALRTGNVDVLFGDNMRLIYWVAGDASQGCCKLLGGAFSDFDQFSRNLAFLMPRARADLKAAFDYGLDMAQKKGTTARIFKAYVPLSPW